MRQKQKNLLTLLLLGGIAAAVAGYAWFGVKEPGEREAAEQQANERLFAPGPGSEAENASVTVQQITVEARGGTTRLEKREGGWWIVAPVETPADPQVVDALSSQLQTAKFKKQIEATPTAEDLERYGLNKPAFTVTALAWPTGDPAKRREVSLKGGIENPFDGSIYMQRNDDPAVWSAEGSVRWSFDKSLFELRQKEVLALDAAKVQRLEVKSPRADLALERLADKKRWKLVRPREEPADAAAVASLLDGLESSRALTFLEATPEQRKQLGFDQAAFDVRLLEEGSDPVRVRFVKTKIDGVDKLYALREQGARTTLAEVTEGALSALEKSPAQLRDRSVLSFDREAVAELTFRPEGGGAAITLERTQTADAGVAEAWSVTAPRRGEARKWKVASVLWSLATLKASAQGEEKPKSWETYGVTKASPSVVLKDADGKTLAMLQVGQEVPDQPGTRWVRGTRDQVLLVDAARLMELPSQLSDVMDVNDGVDGGNVSTSPP